VAFNPNGRVMLTGSLDCAARLWNTETGKPVGPRLQHASGITAAAFSHDGKQVLTGSYDGTARLWESASSKPISLPLAHGGKITAVAFSPDDRLVANREQRPHGQVVGSRHG
jgi:eukaryotic-like serine/threonine-protein kinase